MSDANNHEDVTRLFAAERAPMVHLATLLVGSPAVAEELVQDAFVSVANSWDRLERPGAYLRTSVVTLEELWLGSNRLSGPVPPELGQLTRLQALSLDDNELSGAIPPELGTVSRQQRGAGAQPSRITRPLR